MAILNTGSMFKNGHLIENVNSAQAILNSSLASAKVYIDDIASRAGDIIEGSNSNGSWLRLPNGIQICWNTQGLGDLSLSAGWGQIYARNIRQNLINNFPVAFKTPPTVVKGSVVELHTIIQGTTGLSVSNYFSGELSVLRASVAEIQNLDIMYIAIGNW